MVGDLVVREARPSDARAIAEVSVASRRWSYRDLIAKADLDRAVWGRSIATAALTAFLDDVTERPLFAHVAVTNVGSAKVLERCGFVEVGRQTTDVEEIVYRLA